MTELADILARLVANDEKRQEEFATHQQQITQLLQNIKQPGPVKVEVAAPAPEAAVVKAEKIQKIHGFIRRSTRVKPYKASSDIGIKVFLKRFEEELQSIKLMVGLAADLTRDEYVPILRSCLELPVKERVD